LERESPPTLQPKAKSFGGALYNISIMTREKKFSWSTFVDGMFWVLFSGGGLGGLGVGVTLEAQAKSNMYYTGWFIILLALVVTVFVLWAVIETSWHYKD